MTFRSEPADLGKGFQDSVGAVVVPDDQGNVSTLSGVQKQLLM